MVRLLKFLVFLVVLGGLGLVGYAYLGDLSPEPRDEAVPVDLNGG